MSRAREAGQRGPSSRQLRRSRRSFDRLNSRFEQQAAARLRDSSGADGAAVATPALAERPRGGLRGLERDQPRARVSASTSRAARGLTARRGTKATPVAAPKAALARSGEPLVSRADGSCRPPAASQLGGPVDSRADGYGEASSASQLGMPLASRADGSARRGLASWRW